MAPLPVEIEQTKTNNRTYTSSQTIGFVQNGVNVTTFSPTITTNANVVQVLSAAVVTSAAGQLQVNTQTIDKGGYGVTSVASAVTTTANVVLIHGQRAVTTAAGKFDVNVTRIQSSNAVTTSAGILDVNVIQTYGTA